MFHFLGTAVNWTSLLRVLMPSISCWQRKGTSQGGSDGMTRECLSSFKPQYGICCRNKKCNKFSAQPSPEPFTPERIQAAFDLKTRHAYFQLLQQTTKVWTRYFSALSLPLEIENRPKVWGQCFLPPREGPWGAPNLGTQLVCYEPTTALKDLNLRLHFAFQARRWSPLSPAQYVDCVCAQEQAVVCFVPVMEGPVFTPLQQWTAFQMHHTSTEGNGFVPLVLKGRTNASMGKKVFPPIITSGRSCSFQKWLCPH